MLIDWFTVIAQIINFLILVWLLKRYLYGPVLRAIDERDQRIAAQLREAAAKEAEAEKERSDFQRKNAEFEQHRKALYGKALADSEAERQRLLGEARSEFELLRAKLRETLRNEQQDLGQEITRRLQQEVFAIARKILADLATASLEEQMADVFIRRLHELQGAEKDGLAAALRSATRPVVVRSVFELPAAKQASIGEALRKLFSINTQVGFEERSEQVGGIELLVNGFKLPWSIADYLTALERHMSELLSDQAEAEPTPAEDGSRKKPS